MLDLTESSWVTHFAALQQSHSCPGLPLLSEGRGGPSLEGFTGPSLPPVKLGLFSTYHSPPCPHYCPDSSDFMGMVKKNIPWEPGGILRKPRVIIEEELLCQPPGSKDCKQQLEWWLSVTSTSSHPATSVVEKLPGPYLIPSLELLLRRASFHVSHCVPSQTASLGYRQRWLTGEISWLPGSVMMFLILGTHHVQLGPCFLYYRISLKTNKHQTVFISYIWAVGIENITNEQQDDIWEHTMESFRLKSPSFESVCSVMHSYKHD